MKCATVPSSVYKKTPAFEADGTALESWSFWLVVADIGSFDCPRSTVVLRLRNEEGCHEERTKAFRELRHCEGKVLGPGSAGAKAFYQAFVVPAKAEVHLVEYEFRLPGCDAMDGFRHEVPILRYCQRCDLVFPVPGFSIVEMGNELGEPHSCAPGQMFAYDIIPVEPSGALTRYPPLSGADILGYGRPVSAPATGEVVGVERDVPDRTGLGPPSAGELGGFAEHPRTALGNYVVIKHNSSEYSLLCHLKHESIRVGLGDGVTQGQHIGAVGNSGNSTLPHLHYALLSSGDPFGSQGLPCNFSGWEPAMGVDAYGPAGLGLKRGAFVHATGDPASSQTGVSSCSRGLPL